MDPWVLQSKPLKEQRTSDSVFEFYVQYLKPFTRYKLKVFVMNSLNQSDPNMSLDLIGEQTFIQNFQFETKCPSSAKF